MSNPGKNSLLILLAASAVIFNECREATVPKPEGYFRIDLPPKDYVTFNSVNSKAGNLPVTFEYPSYGKISFDSDLHSEPGWFNIDFPSHKARIYLTYKPVRKDLGSLMEQTYTMNVKNHVTKADAINEQMISDPDRKVYGILYDLKGNTATAVQFFVTDSTKHFFRGSLYFSAEPNPDSLAPVTDFFREDIIHLIETLKWSDK
jgi:gliding motility-associated lipoprotein GldD